MSLLEVTNLRVTLNTARGPADALRGVSFAIDRGDTVGLIGESGCGKSITALALMGLLPEGAIVNGSIRLDGRELVNLSEGELCQLRGRRMGMVFQEPMTALNPLHTVGHQISEPLRVHLGLSPREARARALQLLERVRVPQAARRLDVAPERCAAIEDSTSGLRSAAAAGMKVVAVPNPHFPPGDDALELAAVTVASLCDLRPELI